MTTITVLEQQFRDGKASGFKITLSDGTSGYLDEKASDKGLRVNDPVNFTVVTPEGKSYKKVTCKLAQQSQPPTVAQPPVNPAPRPTPPTVNQPVPVFQAKANASIKAMEFMVSMFLQDKLTWDQIQPKFKELNGYLSDAIDECAQ